jgi:antitoxin ParD1/3/4
MLVAKPRQISRHLPPPPAQPDAAVETWLRDEVLPVYDAMQADPGRGISSDQVVSALEARHANRLNKTTSGA